MVTYFVVQSFQKGRKGMLIADEPKQARDAIHCLALAEKASAKAASVIAFSRHGDPTTGEWADAEVMAQYGEEVPDLTELPN